MIVSALLKPKTVIPSLLGLALLVFLWGTADPARVAQIVQTLPESGLVAAFGLVTVYELLRGFTWQLLLHRLNLSHSRWAASLAFMAGESVRGLPLGSYFQDYVLRQLEAERPTAGSAAATTALLWLEAGVCLLIVAVLGVPGWTWLRPLAVGVLVVAGAAIWSSQRWGNVDNLVGHATRLLASILSKQQVTVWVGEVRSLVTGMVTLVRPRTIALGVLPTALYLVAMAALLYVVASQLGIRHVTPLAALAAYAFGVAVADSSPLPFELGVTEVSGVAALMAFGAGREEAIAVMLLMRALTTIAIWFIGVTLFVVVRCRSLAPGLRTRLDLVGELRGRQPGAAE